jgi:excisionase family DNA binding protein
MGYNRKEKELLTVSEVAKNLDLKETTIRQYLRTGKLNGIKIEQKEWRILRTDFNDFINSNRVRSVVPYLSLIRAASKEIWILGINALGPLHQGREAIIKQLKKGVNVKILLLNTESHFFLKRVKKEDPEHGIETGRLFAESQAAVAICRDIMFASADAPGYFEVRVYSRTPKEAIVIIDPTSNSGFCNVNLYPLGENSRGLTGTEIEYKNIGKSKKTFAKYVSRYKTLWNSRSHRSLMQNKSL